MWYDSNDILYTFCWASNLLSITSKMWGYGNNDFLEYVLDRKTPIKSLIVAIILFDLGLRNNNAKNILQHLKHIRGCIYEANFSHYSAMYYDLRNFVNNIQGLSFYNQTKYTEMAQLHQINFVLDPKIFTPEYKRNVITLAKIKGMTIGK